MEQISITRIWGEYESRKEMGLMIELAAINVVQWNNTDLETVMEKVVKGIWSVNVEDIKE